MKHTRFFCFFLIFVLLLGLTACSSKTTQNELELFQKSINDLFGSLDNNDKEGLKQLFSKNVLNNDSDLDEQIDKLFSVYSGSKTEILFDGILGGEYDNEGNKIKSTVFATFPVLNNDKYYWFYVELTYQDDFSSDNIGLNRVSFYTADEYCIIFKEDNETIQTELGLSIFAEKILEKEVRCINMCPYEFTPIERTLTIPDVETFLNSNKSRVVFFERFGQPNTDIILGTCYYEITNFDGDVLYLQLDVENDAIVYANILDHTKFIRAIIEE